MKPGDVVTLVTLSCVPSVLCLYALNKIGAIVNYVNVLSSQEEIESYITDASSKVVVALDLFAEKVLNVARNTPVHRIITYSLAGYNAGSY